MLLPAPQLLSAHSCPHHGSKRAAGCAECPRVSSCLLCRYAKLRASDGKEVIGFENIELISDRPLEVMLEEFKRVSRPLSLVLCSYKGQWAFLLLEVMLEDLKRVSSRDAPVMRPQRVVRLLPPALGVIVLLRQLRQRCGQCSCASHAGPHSSPHFPSSHLRCKPLHPCYPLCLPPPTSIHYLPACLPACCHSSRPSTPTGC